MTRRSNINVGWGRIYVSENPARERNSIKTNDEKCGQLLRNLFTVPRSARVKYDVLYFGKAALLLVIKTVTFFAGFVRTRTNFNKYNNNNNNNMRATGFTHHH